MLPEETGLVLRKAAPLHELGPDDAAARSRNRGAGRADAAQCRSRDRRLAVHEAVHRFAEACRPPAAALLAVAEGADAGPLLDVEDAQHRVVLDLPQVIERDSPVKVGLPGLVDLGGADEAADLVCAISHLVHSLLWVGSLALQVVCEVPLLFETCRSVRPLRHPLSGSFRSHDLLTVKEGAARLAPVCGPPRDDGLPQRGHAPDGEALRSLLQQVIGGGAQPLVRLSAFLHGQPATQLLQRRVAVRVQDGGLRTEHRYIREDVHGPQ